MTQLKVCDWLFQFNSKILKFYNFDNELLQYSWLKTIDNERIISQIVEISKFCDWNGDMVSLEQQKLQYMWIFS